MIEVSREEFIERYHKKMKVEDILTTSFTEFLAGSAYDMTTKESDCIILDREGWQRIKALIENKPKFWYTYYERNKMDKWLEELGRAMMEDCPFLNKCINQNTDKCRDCLGDTGRKNYVRKDDEVMANKI